MFKTYCSFNTHGIDVGSEFSEVNASFLKHHSMGGN